MLAMTEAAMKTIRCCVPFCHRTHRNVESYAEWCCSAHFGLTDAMARKIYRRMIRRGAAAASRDRIWGRLRRQAIERAAGI